MGGKMCQWREGHAKMVTPSRESLLRWGRVLSFIGVRVSRTRPAEHDQEEAGWVTQD